MGDSMSKFYIIFFLMASIAHATRIDISNINELNTINNFLGVCNSSQSAELRSYNQQITNSLVYNYSNWPKMSLMSLKKNFVEVENRVWIDNNPKHENYRQYWEIMKGNFDLMLSDSQKGISFQCSTSSDRRCNDGVIAYVVFLFNRPIKTIHLCPIFWNDSHDGRLSTLFHELSHYSASTFDYAGDWWNGKDNINAVRGAKDAYHLQEFYYKNTDMILKRMIWNWWWPKK